jgi:hypothetical protein
MFKMSTVSTCPVAKASRGRLRIDEEILGWFAGAAEDDLEWLALLLGTASEDGFDVTVDNLFVPTVQARSSGSCDVEDRDIPEGVRSHIVGVVHSHHSMGAFFSGTDRGEDGVNARFACSIVVSSRMKHPIEYNMGFGFEAEGRVVLGCGSIAVVKFVVAPLNDKDWPYSNEVLRDSDLVFKDKEVHSIGDCDNFSLSATSNRYMSQKAGKCDLHEKEALVRPYVFGKNGKPIVERLPKPIFNKGSYGGKVWTPGQGLVEIGSGGRNDERGSWWTSSNDRRGISRESYSGYNDYLGYARVEERTKVDDDQTIDDYSQAYLKGWGHDPRE